MGTDAGPGVTETKSVPPAGIRNMSPSGQAAARSLYGLHRPGSRYSPCKCHNIVVMQREENSFWGGVHVRY